MRFVSDSCSCKQATFEHFRYETTSSFVTSRVTNWRGDVERLERSRQQTDCACVDVDLDVTDGEVDVQLASGRCVRHQTDVSRFHHLDNTKQKINIEVFLIKNID